MSQKLKFSTLLLFYILFYLSYANKQQKNKSSPNKPIYKAPGSAKYPFGDEAMSDNILDGKGVAGCIDQENNGLNFHSKCFSPAKQLDTQEIYVSCFNETLRAEMDKIFFKSAMQCAKCSLKKTGDNLAVVLECGNCRTQLPPPAKRSKGAADANLLLLTYFLEIGNYTGNVDL